MNGKDKVVFRASMPPIGSALKISGDGNGMRLQLDIPEIEMDKAAWLLAMRQSRLIITVEVEQDDSKIEKNTEKTSRY